MVITERGFNGTGLNNETPPPTGWQQSVGNISRRMKLRGSHNQSIRAMTLTEVVVVACIMVFLLAMLLPALLTRPHTPHRSYCITNLKEVGLAYKIWSGDNNNRFPNAVSATNGGSMERAMAGEVVTAFQVMSNALSTPKILICVTDTGHHYATNFSVNFTTSNISYFIGVDATDAQPGGLLSGDANLVVNGRPAPPGLLNLATTTASWTKTRHKTTGNVLFCDGSVSMSVPQMGRNSAPGGLTNTDRLAIP